MNAVIQAEWNGEPEELMRRLLRIEQEQGRTRLVHWGPRTLDLDVIWGEHIISDSALLRLPHPFFWERAFVLVPMAEIAPGFSYHGQTIEARISELDSERWCGGQNGIGRMTMEPGKSTPEAEGLRAGNGVRRNCAALTC